MSSMSFGLPGSIGGDAVLLTRSFSDLSLAVQQLGQWENSADITPAILLQAINYGLVEGYDYLVKRWSDYYTLDTTFPIESGELRYTLSAVAPGFYKLRHLAFTRDAVVTASSRFKPMSTHAIEGAYSFANKPNIIPRYRMQGRDLVLTASPVGTIKIFYIPIMPQFSDVNDDLQITFEVPTEERLIIHLAMRDLLLRSDLNTDSVDGQIERLIGLLRSAGSDRDAGEPFSLDPNGPPRGYDCDDDGGW